MSVNIVGALRRKGDGCDRGLPEDWDPRDFIQYSSLLSKAEVSAVLRAEKRQGDPDAVLLAKKLRELAFDSADGFDFPYYAALVNPIAQNAFAMRFKRHEVHAQRSKILPLVTVQRIMNLTTSSQICDAQLLIRPYIKILGEPSVKGSKPSRARYST